MNYQDQDTLVYKVRGVHTKPEKTLDYGVSPLCYPQKGTLPIPFSHRPQQQFKEPLYCNTISEIRISIIH